MLLSIRGLYNYRPTIFNDFQVPSGMNKQAAIADILLNCSELSVVYPDPEMMEEAIKWWTLTELENWTRAWNALQLEYNPIWNVDGTIEETEERDLENSENRTYQSVRAGTRSSEDDGTSGNTRTDNLANSETTVNGVSGFNIQQGFTDADNTVVNGTDTGSVTDAGTTHNEREESENEQTNDTEAKTGTDSGTITRTTRRTGNIGVTTSQQMLREELEIAEVNIYHRITDSFKRRFCVMVY